MMENYDKEFWKQKPCPKYDCKKDACKCGLKKVFLPASLGDDSASSPVAPKNGAYCDAIVVYEANKHVYIYSKDGVPTLVDSGSGDYYTKGQVDTLLAGKQDELTAGSNITISGNTISATDTTYNNFVGTDGVDDGTAGLVPAPTTTDINKFLKSDGTWEEVNVSGDTAFTVLTDDDANYTHPDEPDTPYIALWLLPGGKYMIDENATIAVLPGLSDGAIGDMYYAHQNPIFLSSNSLAPNSEADIHALQAEEAIKYIVAIDDGEIDERNAYTQPFVGTDGVDPGAPGLVPVPEATDADKFLKSDGTWGAVGGGGIGIKLLTADDYNYPTNSPDRVNPSMLPSGFYQLADSSVYIQEEAKKNSRQDRLYYVSAENAQGYNFVFDFFGNSTISGGTSVLTVYRCVPSTGNMTLFNTLVSGEELLAYVGTQSGSDPTTATKGTIGQILVNSTSQDVFVCTSTSGGTYIWKKITTT